MNNDDNQNQQNNPIQPQLQGQATPLQNQQNQVTVHPHGVETAPAPQVQKQPEQIAVSKPETSETFQIRSSEVAPRLHPEVAEAGVEAVSEKPEITQEHKDLGIEPAKETVPVKTQPSDSVVIPNAPLSEQKAREVVKLHKKISQSILWMAASMLRQVKKNRRLQKRSEL